MCILLDTSASCLLLCVFFGWQLNSCSSRLKQSPQGISQCSSFTVSIFHDQSYSLVRTTLPFPTPSTPFMALSLDTPVVTRLHLPRGALGGASQLGHFDHLLDHLNLSTSTEPYRVRVRKPSPEPSSVQFGAVTPRGRRRLVFAGGRRGFSWVTGRGHGP